MQQVTSDIMTFRGSHFELGVKTGKWLQQTPLLKIEKRMEKRVPRFDIDVNETYQIFQTYAPQIWEELMGLQSILKMPTRQIILNFGHYRFTDLKESGCMVFKAKTSWLEITITTLQLMMVATYYINLQIAV